MSAPRRGQAEIRVFGRRSVLEAIDAPAIELERVLVAKDVPGPFRKELRSKCDRAGVELEVVSRTGLTEFTRAPRHDQGVGALCRFTLVSEADQFLESLTGPRARTPTRVLALDGITNPQNVGMIIRSALAAGIDAMLWPLLGSPWIGGLVIKASASTIYRLPIVRCETLEDGVRAFKTAGFKAMGLEAGGAVQLGDHTPPHRALYVVGGETVGISPGVRELLDARLSIPMAPGVESLNVAGAGTLLCYHATGLLRRAASADLSGVD